MSNRKVSVILPTYNQKGKWLDQAIDSVLIQDCTFKYEDVEFIVVDDGSTNGTSYYIREKAPISIQLYKLSKNSGLPTALNVGFEHSHGDYLTWISSDCWCEPNFLEVLVKALDEAPKEVGMVYSDFNIIGENDEFIKRFCWPNMTYPLLLIRNLGNASFLYRRECMDKIGLYDTDLFGCEDWDYWIRMGEHYRFKHICQPLYNYRWHSKSLQSTKRNMVLESRAKMMMKTFDRISEIPCQ